jgi:hypothetical protein
MQKTIIHEPLLFLYQLRNGLLHGFRDRSQTKAKQQWGKRFALLNPGFAFKRVRSATQK